MRTQLIIDDSLINEALALGHFKTREDTVIQALREFINRRKQKNSSQNNNHVIFGVMEGAFAVPDNFDDPLPVNVENDFYTTTL